MASKPDNGPQKLEIYRKMIEDIEYTLSMTSPRMFTTNDLIDYEERMREVLEAIRKASSSEVYSSMDKNVMLANIRNARDELALAIQELTEKGKNRQFISYIRRCCSYLEDALQDW